MAEKPLRFVHASDLHLERSLSGVAQIPSTLRELFRDAQFHASRKLFDHALAERVDFVILSGDVLDYETCGARGLSFLAEQFARLNLASIGVYWAAGMVDAPGRGPTAQRWPENVRQFSAVRPHEFVHVRRDGAAVAHLVGQSSLPTRGIRAADFWAHTGGLPSIAVAYGEIAVETLAARGIGYWALGGQHTPCTVLESPCLAQYPGTIQGREPDESGAHGCTLVEWPTDDVPRHSPIDCDVVRWHSIELSVDTNTTREQLQRALAERVSRLVAAHPSVTSLVAWNLRGEGAIASQVRRGRLATEVLTWLRSEFGARSPCVWSLSLTADAVKPRVSTSNDESLLGKYLGAIDSISKEPDSDLLDLSRYVAEADLTSDVAGLVSIADARSKARVLHEATLLGVDLLAGEETRA
jgi:DNA repair exonuclease SbcCD nuclease subunit